MAQMSQAGVPLPLAADFDYTAYMTAPRMRPPGPFSLRKRNELNCVIQNDNDQSLLQTDEYRQDPTAHPDVGPPLKAFYSYTQAELDSLLNNEFRRTMTLPDHLHT